MQHESKPLRRTLTAAQTMLSHMTRLVQACDQSPSPSRAHRRCCSHWYLLRSKQVVRTHEQRWEVSPRPDEAALSHRGRRLPALAAQPPGSRSSCARGPAQPTVSSQPLVHTAHAGACWSPADRVAAAGLDLQWLSTTRQAAALGALQPCLHQVLRQRCSRPAGHQHLPGLLLLGMLPLLSYQSCLGLQQLCLKLGAARLLGMLQGIWMPGRIYCTTLSWGLPHREGWLCRRLPDGRLRAHVCRQRPGCWLTLCCPVSPGR